MIGFPKENIVSKVFFFELLDGIALSKRFFPGLGRPRLNPIFCLVSNLRDKGRDATQLMNTNTLAQQMT